MNKLSCNSNGLCCICKYMGLCNGEDSNHTTLFEKANLKELENRLNSSSLTPKEEIIIKASINTYKNDNKIDNDLYDEVYEDLDIPIIHSKKDIMIISKAQYDRMIAEGIKLENELEDLQKKYKDLYNENTGLKAKYDLLILLNNQ